MEKFPPLHYISYSLYLYLCMQKCFCRCHWHCFLFRNFFFVFFIYILRWNVQWLVVNLISPSRRIILVILLLLCFLFYFLLLSLASIIIYHLGFSQNAFNDEKLLILLRLRRHTQFYRNPHRIKLIIIKINFTDLLLFGGWGGRLRVFLFSQVSK